MIFPKNSSFESDLHQYYYLRIAAVYIRGKIDDHTLSEDLLTKPLTDLSEKECEELFQYGRNAGLKLHRFKRSASLPRVQRIISALKGLHPASLLDIGTGRGVFLSPLLNTFPWLPVTCIDLLGFRCTDIQAAARGGIENLNALQMDAGFLAFKERCFDGVTLLETLEHAPDPEMVIHEVCRVAGRFVLLSVPSKADNNPEHIHLFSTRHLRRLFDSADNFKVNFDTVLNHIIAIAIRH